MLVVLVISSTVIAMGLTMMLVVAFPVVLSMVSSVMLSMVVPVMVSRIWMRGGMIALHIGHIVPLVDEL